MYTAIEVDRVNVLKLNVEMVPCHVEGHGGDFIRLSPLAFAASRSAFNCLEFLAEKIQIKDDINEIGTILHVAIYFKVDLKKFFEGRSEVFKSNLREIINKPNGAGKTPFYLAAELSQEKSLEVLNAYGADIESVDHEGLTPAHAAAINCDDVIIKRLHDWGANFENTGQTKDSDNPVTYLKKFGNINRHGRVKIGTTITLIRNYIQEQRRKRAQQIVTSSPSLRAISRKCTDFLQTRLANDEKSTLKDEIFDLLYETIPKLNVAELRQLISKDYPLEHFLMSLPRSLINEAKLALTLGDRYHAQNNPTDAFYFYSIAVALAEKTDDFLLKKETHGKASNYIFEIFLGSKEFDDIVIARLDKVIEEDKPDEIKKQFDTLLILQHFFSDKEKQRSFFAKIDAYVHGGNFNPLKITRLYDNYSEVVPTNNRAITLTSLATKRSLIALQEYRQILNTLFSSNNSAELQQAYLKAFNVFFEKLLQNSFAIVGRPACHYEVRLLGSYGKGEITPFSSLNFIIIFEDDEQQEYFENLWEILWMQFICLGESIDHAVNQNALSFPLSEHGILPGLRIQKALDNRIPRVGTVVTYMGLARHSSCSLDILRIYYQSSGFPQQNHQLFDQFANAILPRNQDGSRHHRLGQELEKNIQNRTFYYKALPSLDCKSVLEENFIENFLVQLLLDLGLVLKIPHNNPRGICEKLSAKDHEAFQLSNLTVGMIKQALDFNYRMRFEWEKVRTSTFLSIKEEQLAADDREELKIIFDLIIEPLYKLFVNEIQLLAGKPNPTIVIKGSKLASIFVKLDLPSLALAGWQRLDATRPEHDAKLKQHIEAVKTVAKLCSDNQEYDHDAINFYGGLGFLKCGDELFREPFITILERGGRLELAQKMLAMPNREGVRLSVSRRRKKFRQSLEYMTQAAACEFRTGWQIKIRSPLLGNRYLRFNEAYSQSFAQNGHVHEMAI